MINLPQFCIRRPAFTIVISLVMIMLGVLGFMNLPVRWIPNVAPPQISINASYPGANASLVERDVTKIIEESLSGVNGVETVSSTSRQGSSSIYITFKLGHNMDAAVQDVRGSIDRIRGSLPREMENPIISKADQNAEAIMYVSFSSTQMTPRELGDYLDKFVVPTFETAEGVGSVIVYGKRVSAMRVSLDPDRMAATNVTVEEIAGLLQEQSASIPSGQIRTQDRFYSVITNPTARNAEQFNDLIIHANKNQLVRLRDVGIAKLDVEDDDGFFRVNGKQAMALAILPQSNANPLDVANTIKKVFNDVKRSLPAGIQASIDYDQTDYIRASIHSVYESFFEAVLFVWIVIFGFLCNFRSTLIPVITIPVCLISTFAVLSMMGFSINTITLMAFVLAIGLVVDDAIVMLENISRYMEEGMSPLNAALKGSREIVFPIIAMTLTLAAVYAPIAFTPGLLGVLFREFTFTLAGAVIISGVVALTLSPMMCAKLLKPTRSGTYQQWLTAKLAALQDRYQTFLKYILTRRKWVAGFLLLVAAAGVGFYYQVPSELAPTEDMGSIYVFSSAPRDASYEYTNANAAELESIYQTYPDVRFYFSANASASHSFQLIQLKPKSQRIQPMSDVVDSLTEKVNMIPGVRVNVSVPPSALAEVTGSDDGDNLGIVLMTTSDYRKLQMASQRILDLIRSDKSFTHAENRLKWDSEQFLLNVDQARAADLKVPMSTIASTISTLVAGRQVGKINDTNIFVQMNQGSLANPDIFQRIYLRNAEGAMIPLSHVLDVKEVTAPEVFNHYSRLRADNIFISMAPDVPLSTAIKKLETILKNNLPDDIRFTFTGEAKSFLDSNGKSAVTFLLALVFIYLVLVAQFESFIDPLVILFTVPFAMVGALLTLNVFGGSLNIYSNIGLITLVGLIAKHGILITEFANRLRREGKAIQEAVIEAATLRLRPILMTTAAMILGAMPLAFAFGPGSESRQQVGLVIAGGLLFGTVFSLVVVPVTYTFLAPFRRIKTDVAEGMPDEVLV